MKTQSIRHSFFKVLVAVTVVALATAAQAQPGGAVGQAPAEITVIVPADAAVFFDGAATVQKGKTRVFTSPPLEAGKKYTYVISARWSEAGKPVERSQQVKVTAGAKVRVDFLKAGGDATGPLSEDDALQLATEAYIYGYPLITMEMTRRVMTNTAAPDGRAPMGQFHYSRKYPDASFRDVTAPNADTLYSSAFLNVESEPYILSLPEQKDRYYLMPMLSAWTDVFAVPGTRMTGTGAQKYAITGPKWKGTLPEGVTQLRSPTSLVWILGRTYCTGTPEDYKAVHELQDKYVLVPLSAYGKPYTPPAGKVDPKIDMKTPVRDQVNQLSAGDFFKLVARLLIDNPPAAEDAPMVAKLARIGIVPGKDFDIAKLDAAVAKGLERAPKAGQEKIMAHFKTAGKDVNGWRYLTQTGLYGTDYLQRAAVAAVGLGANLPEDAIYPVSLVDSEGQPYSGANKYVIHFDKGQTPPVKGFWSITMYNDQFFFVENPINRYTVSSRFKFTENPDGSLDLYIQKDSPGKDKEANWLPAPEGRFILMLRMYWPEQAVIDGAWKPPAVKKVVP
jgi:uncharacterized protein (TIGR03000 family)